MPPLFQIIVIFLVGGISVGIWFFDWIMVRRSRGESQFSMGIGYLAGILLGILIIMIDQLAGNAGPTTADVGNINLDLAVVLAAFVTAGLSMLFFRVILQTRAAPVFVVLTVAPTMVSLYFLIAKPQIGGLLTIGFIAFLIGVAVYLILDHQLVNTLRAHVQGRRPDVES